MSINISKVLRVVSSDKKISTKLYESFINDINISDDLKRKIGLYYRGDKRLSTTKLKNTLKSTKIQRGGGWKIGVVKNKGDIDVEGSKLAYDFDSDSSPTISITEQIFNNVLTQIGFVDLLIGSGAFANVYNIINNGTIVVKLFRQDLPIVYNNTKVCITEFLENFPTFIKYTSFSSMNNVFVHTNIPRYGYLMNKMSPITTVNLEIFTKAKETLLIFQKNTTNQNYNFIHGDIKIENMLDNGGDIVMTDMDGVFVYDIKTLQHISNKNYSRQIYMTPVCTHPILPWYTQMLRIGIDFDNFTIGDDHMIYWDAMWAHMSGITVVQIVKAEIIKILNTKYQNDYRKSINVFLKSNKINDIHTWIMNQLANVDLYSLGASALFHSLKTGDKTLYRFALNTMNTALIEIPQNNQVGSSPSQQQTLKYQYNKFLPLNEKIVNVPTLKDIDIVNQRIVWNLDQ